MKKLFPEEFNFKALSEFRSGTFPPVFKGMLLFLGVLLLFTGCLRNPVTSRRQAKVISEAAEKEIGAETHRQIVDEYGEVRDAVLREYVSALGRKIVAVSDRPRLEFTFTILDTDLVNAFAAPGGYIFVTRGLLGQLNNEAELAVVLGHEIGHVCAWHSIQMIQKQMGYGALATLGAIASGIKAGPEAMIMVAQAADLFTTLYILGYSREFERQADHVGIRYAISAGYKPGAALSFFERLSELEKREGLDKWQSYFASHPPTGERIQLAKKFIDLMSVVQRPLSENESLYLEMRDRIPRLPSGELGRVSGSVYTNAKRGVTFTLPDGWKWEEQRRMTLSSFREAKGSGWGELHREPPGQFNTAKGLAEKWAKEKQWTQLQGRSVLYPAGYGYLGQFYGTGLMGGLFQFRALFLVRDGAGYVLYCGAPPEDINKYLIPFEQILRSFQLD